MFEVRNVVAAVLGTALSAGAAWAAGGGTLGAGPLGAGDQVTIPTQVFAALAGPILPSSTLTSIADTWSFSLASKLMVNGLVFSSSYQFDNEKDYKYGMIDSFQVRLDGQLLAHDQVAGGVFSTGGGGTIWIDRFTLAPTALGAGGHTLTVSGLAEPYKGSSYDGSLSISALPVPEPETWAMMLAGLGAIGFMAGRRRA